MRYTTTHSETHGHRRSGRRRPGLRTLSSTFAAAFLAASLVSVAAAQEGDTGRVLGRVLDAQTGRGLVGARVIVAGTGVGTLTGIDGRFLLPGVPAGPVDLTVSYLGYGEKTVTGVEVPGAGAAAVDVGLEPAALEIAGITVTVAGERGTISRALDEQRTSVGVVSAVTSEQIARTPDGDAAAAVQRVSGVTVQDGKYVFVRGLGERYTTTSLNGARIPSPDPERKVVPLDLFPAGLLQSITTAKTFTPNLSGDFSGAQVDIRTREFPSRRQVSYSYTLGYTPGVTGRSIVGAPSSGGEWLAAAGGGRDVPAVLDRWSSFEGIRQGDFNQIVRSFRNAWSIDRSRAVPAGAFSGSVGGNDPVFGQRVGYLASATYSLASEARLDEVRAVALPGADGKPVEASRYEGSLGRTSVVWGGLVNLGTIIGADHRLSLNASYNRSADNDGRRERGVDENTGADLRIDRLQYVERSVASGQLRGEHQLGRRHRLDWAASASGVRRREPDRSEVVYLIERGEGGEELPPAWALSGNEVAVRTFTDLRETAVEGSLDYRLSFGSAVRPLDLRVGGLARRTDRDADNRAWSIQAIGANPLTRDRSLRELPPEAIFGETFTGPGDQVFSVVPIAQGGSYRARDRLVAAYGMLEWTLTDPLQLVAGLRAERSDLDLAALSTNRHEYAASPSYTDFLPALSLNLAVTDRQNLRFSISRTLARPEYREVAPIQYREVIGGENNRGNADLRRTLIQNLDLRWELYPASDEVLSVALFAKRFTDPIERIYLASSGTAITTFVNAEGAENFGVEVEVRKGLGALDARLRPFAAFANATWMRSEIRIGNAGLASTTNPNRPMLGQAPYVLNAGLAYTGDGGRTSATLLYNLVGDRIVAAAGAPLPDVYERAKPSLDFALRFPLFAGLSAKLDAENLLDSPHRVEEGEVLREYYRTGRSLSFGVTLRP